MGRHGRRDQRTTEPVDRDRRGLLVAGAGTGALAVWGRRAGVASAGAPQPNARTVIDVRAHGALGDDTADDTAAVQAACDLAASSGGGIVFFPAGTYRVNGISPAANCTLRGDGTASVLRAMPDSSRGAVLNVKARRVTVEHLVIDGNAAAQSAPVNGISVAAPADTVVLRSLTIDEVAAHGIAIAQAVSRVSIESCSISASGVNGVTVSGASQVAVRGNLIIDSGRCAVHLLSYTGACTDVIVEGNAIHGSGTAAPGAPAIWADDGCRAVLIADNSVADTATGCPGISAASSSGRPISSVAVTGNSVRSTDSDGIRLAGDGVVAAGNAVREAGRHGILATGATVSVLANSAVGSSAAGVALATPGALVAGNTARSNGSGAAAEPLDGSLPALPTTRLGILTVGTSTLAVPHGLAAPPTSVLIQARAAGRVWSSAPPDATNVYLLADGAGRSAEVRVR